MSNIEGNNAAGPSKEKAQQGKAAKIRKAPKRSEVWNEFTEEEKDGGKLAKCMHCETSLSSDSKSGTSHLKRHLEKHCTKRVKKEELNNCVFDHERNLELFAKMVIHGKIPLQYVENPLFTEFARSLQPMYTHIDRLAVEKRCLAYYENEKNKVQDEFIKLTSRVSLVVGLYYQEQEMGEGAKRFICVEAHYIDDDFKLVKRMIGFNAIYDGGNENIVAEVERCVYGWGLGKKVLTCAATEDDGSLDIDWRSHISSVICGGEHIKVELFAACLWEIAINVYFEFEEYVKSIRDMNELFKYPMLIELLSGTDEEHSFPCKYEFLIDNLGRWHSVLNMFRDALILKIGFDNSDSFGGFNYLSPMQWTEVENAVELLELIYRVLSYSCPTSNLLLEIYFKIQEICYY